MVCLKNQNEGWLKTHTNGMPTMYIGYVAPLQFNERRQCGGGGLMVLDARYDGGARTYFPEVPRPKNDP